MSYLNACGWSSLLKAFPLWTREAVAHTCRLASSAVDVAFVAIARGSVEEVTIFAGATPHCGPGGQFCEVFTVGALVVIRT
jgi:hypothetical protein